MECYEIHTEENGKRIKLGIDSVYAHSEEEADMVRARMMEVNKVIKIYRFISLNKCSWEIFIEP